jgi:hypothetical protein
MTEYCFILSAVDTHTGARHTTSGTVTPGPDASRLSIFRSLIERMAADGGQSPQQYVPLFFSLEPDRLPAPAGIQRL